MAECLPGTDKREIQAINRVIFLTRLEKKKNARSRLSKKLKEERIEERERGGIWYKPCPSIRFFVRWVKTGKFSLGPRHRVISANF